MKIPSPVAAIAERKHRTAEEIDAANRAHIARLSGVAVKSATRHRRFEFEKPITRLKKRGIPLVGTGGLDDRRDPLAEIIHRETQAERDASVRSKRKRATA